MFIFKISSIRCGFLLVVGAALALSGCASLDSTNSGKIAGSIGMRMTMSDAHFQGAYLGYRSVDKKERGAIGYFPDFVGGALAEIKEGEFHGSTFLKTLPAGEYDFVWQDRTVNLLKPFDDKVVPIAHFSVKPGQVTYVGSWEATPITRERFLGADKMIGYRFMMRNRQDRDLALIHRKDAGAPAVANGPSANPPSRSQNAPDAAVRTEAGTEYLSR